MKHSYRAGLLAAAGALAAIAAQGRAAWALGIGDPAPPIVVKEFVKGSPVTKAPAGKVSVVEFWATWCGPCRESIPHLTELAHKYKNVQFVGVSAFESDQAKVAPFVKQMGAKMDYTVAMDSVPAGAKGADGVMAKTWMEAANQGGIPTAFVVGTDGKIAWIGHPMELDEPLSKITTGKWDAAAAKADFDRKQAVVEKRAAVQKTLQEAAKSGDPKQIVAAIDKIVADDPSMEMSLGASKLLFLLKSGDEDAAVTYGDHLVTDTYKSTPQALNSIAWNLVDPDKAKPSPKVAAFALRAAKRADEASNQKDSAIADTLAAAYFAAGDSANAAKAEQRAIDLSKDLPEKETAEMKQRLEQYKGGSASAAK